MNKTSVNKKRRNAFYYSLAVCVVAGSVAAFSIFGTSPTGNATLDIDSVNSAEAAQKEESTNTGVTAPDVTITDATEEGEAFEAAAQAHVPLDDLSGNIPFESEYILPLTTEIMRDYSDGEFAFCETSGDYRVHNGIDFPADKGTGVRAVITGRVLSVTEGTQYGTMVEVDHGNKLVARYYGVGNVNVSPGDFLMQGDQIGVVEGIPAEGDRPHIHFETLIDGAYADPLAVMGKADLGASHE